MIRPPAFWWQPTPGLLARCLAPVSHVYGWLTLQRMSRKGQRAECPVICVGNFTTGGTGKTPVAIHVAGLLKACGETPVFLSRGYGGLVRTPTRVDPDRHNAADVGDEPLLLARVAPVIVSPDRIAGAALASALGASVIVMDDGLQNPSLTKDLSLAVVDSGTGFGNGLVFPAGPLRAPLAGQKPYADAAIVVGDNPCQARLAESLVPLPVIRAALEPPPDIARRLKGQSVIAMAGIGLPEKFAATLLSAGAIVIERHFVADHAPYSRHDLEALAARAMASGAMVATTEKDLVRIGSQMPTALAERLIVVPVSLVVSDGAEILDRLLGKALAQAQTPSASEGF